MFEHFKRYPWVLGPYRYPSSEQLIADLGERMIDPAEKWRWPGERPLARLAEDEEPGCSGGEAGGGGGLGQEPLAVNR
jgi:hypothetical protein